MIVRRFKSKRSKRRNKHNSVLAAKSDVQISTYYPDRITKNRGYELENKQAL